MNSCEDNKEIGDLEKQLAALAGIEKVNERRKIVEKSHNNCETPKDREQYIRDYTSDLILNIQRYKIINQNYK